MGSFSAQQTRKATLRAPLAGRREPHRKKVSLYRKAGSAHDLGRCVVAMVTVPARGHRSEFPGPCYGYSRGASVAGTIPRCPKAKSLLYSPP